jgi:hypothetical protein
MFFITTLLVVWTQASSLNQVYKLVVWTQASSLNQGYKLVVWTQASFLNQGYKLVVWTQAFTKLKIRMFFITTLLCLIIGEG